MKLSKHNNKPEIFHSIQGEGKSTGIPSIFIRTSLCNLHCIWCDTDYTWNWENTNFKHNNDAIKGYKKYKKEDQIIELMVPEIVDIVSNMECKHIILTGGEPLIQQRELTELMQELKKIDPDYFFEVETNGTIVPVTEFDQAIDQYNVSPKLQNSAMDHDIRIKPKPLELLSRSDKSNFKFVVSSETDLEEIILLQKEFNIDSSKIHLMPEGTTAKQLNEKTRWLVEICKQYNFNFSNRLHVHIWGSKRGI